MYQLNKTLKLLRLSNQLNQATLAHQLDISRSYLSELEAGKKKPSLETLAKYGFAFDLPVWKIIWLSEQQTEFSFSELYHLLSYNIDLSPSN
ncbi:helix-turn-helix transcriptional regulator (plasmid) [Synechocystis sp. B12]|nr:helix-turn-helix transcriptional regulator [Synechocystis sp. B12]